MIALPTDGDLSHTGTVHAGEYIMQLRGEGREAFETFLEQRGQSWNREPRQRIWRCLDHVCNYIAFIVETNLNQQSGKDMSITRQEASAFLKRTKKGIKTKGEIESSLEERGFASSFEELRDKIIQRLQMVRLVIRGKTRFTRLWSDACLR